MSQNPYLFIVGCPRSGTTLLKRLLDAHTRIVIPPESHWIPRIYDERVGLTPDGFVTPELLSFLLDLPKFQRLGIDGEELKGLMERGGPVSYATFVSRVFNSYAQRQGKFLIGDKTPSYARRIRTLHALWPTAKFLHLIRDGRDVCLSYINWKKFQKRANRATWDEDPITTTALWWECHVRMARNAGATLAKSLYYEVRYEALVQNPAAECKGLCEFLEIPYEDAMLRFHEGRTRTKPGLDAKKAWLPITPGLRDWRSQMSADQLERFESASGNLLDELGYPRGTQHLSTATQENAIKIRNLFTQAIRGRTNYSLSDRLSIIATLQGAEGNPNLFVVGCARSGTTLLHRILDANPFIAVTPELHWLFAFKKHQGATNGDKVVSRDTLRALVAHKRFEQLEIGQQEFQELVGVDERLSYTELLTRIFELYKTVKAKPLVANKTPAYVRSIANLHSVWPRSRFVHLIRDGRDVCLSVRNWRKAERNVGRCSTWQADPVTTTALWWKRKVQLGREAGLQLGPELYYELRYEDLTTNPEPECKALCSFLEVPYDESMLHFHEGRMRKNRNGGTKSAWLPITKGLRNWQTQMSAQDVEKFEAVAGDLLQDLGYVRSVLDPKAEAEEHASQIYEIFTQDARARKHQLPKNW